MLFEVGFSVLFNSYAFILVYLPVTFAAFFFTAKYICNRASTLVLVLASFIFYGYWDVHYVPLLGYFKYTDFFLTTVSNLSGSDFDVR